MHIWCILLCIHIKQTASLRYSRVDLHFFHKIGSLPGPKGMNKHALSSKCSRGIRKAQEYLKTQEMCSKVVADSSCVLKHVPDHLKTQEMCNQVVINNPYMLKYVPITLRHKKCVIRPLKQNHFYWDASLTVTKLKRCLKKQLKMTPLQYRDLGASSKTTK